MKRFILLFAMLPSLLSAQISLPLAQQTPPKGTSHLEMVKFLKEIAKRSNLLEIENGILSHEGREIPVVFLPKKKHWKKENLTVMLFAQQHGDEPSGKEALLMLIHQICFNPQTEKYTNLNLILVPMVNPDGNEADQRRNSRKVDLNRNHVVLTEPETQLLHSLFEIYKPQITLDIHEYGITSWLKEGFIKDFGEQLDCISNMAIPRVLKDFAQTELLEPTLEMTRRRGVNANRYLVSRSSINEFVRHSTTDIDDGRNSFGIHYTLSFILEGANGFFKEDRIWQRAKHQLTLIENFLKLCQEKANKIVKLVQDLRKEFADHIPDSVVIQADYTSLVTRALPVKLIRTQDFKETTVTLPDYRPEPEAIVTIKTPQAYIIEKPALQIQDLIKYHNLPYQLLTSERTYVVEQFTISGADTLGYESRDTIIPEGSFVRLEKTFHGGDMIVPLNNIRAVQIVLMLEPQSFYGISHYNEFQFLWKDTIYPIYRVLE